MLTKVQAKAHKGMKGQVADLLIAIIIPMLLFSSSAFSVEPIKVGILHSLTGTMSISEVAVANAEKMAIDEINAQGGPLGRKIEPIIVDGKSDPPTFATEAERLITKDKVSVVFGCWTSSSRRTVKPVFERLNHLLFYPLQYEGLEQSPNIVYTGAAPNQQIIPAVKWAYLNLGKTFYLVGSDYVFPRSANAIIAGQLKQLHGKVLGEKYIILGSTDVDAVVRDIVKKKPKVILNSINGDSNVAFFRALRAHGVTSDRIPTISFSIGEPELQVMGTKELFGDYAVWNYFQSLDTPENKTFVASYKAKFGADQVVDDPMEAGYLGVYLWANAVKAAGTDDVNAVRLAVKNSSFDAPEGRVYVDQDNNHTWKSVHIGKVIKDGQFEIVWSSSKIVQPVPYPNYKSKKDWNVFLTSLYDRWGHSWTNPRKRN